MKLENPHAEVVLVSFLHRVLLACPVMRGWHRRVGAQPAHGCSEPDPGGHALVHDGQVVGGFGLKGLGAQGLGFVRWSRKGKAVFQPV